MSDSPMSDGQQRELPTPVVEQHDRLTRVLWPVGEPDAEGFQRYAALSVHYYGRGAGYPENQYRAHLKHAEIKRRDGHSSEKISVLSGAGCPISTLAAARFNRRTLEAFTATCRALVVRRYAEGDPTVVGLMQPAGREGQRA